MGPQVAVGAVVIVGNAAGSAVIPRNSRFGVLPEGPSRNSVSTHPAPFSVLLVRRGREPLLGQWTLPGGKVKEGEPLVDATRREVLEETAIAIEVAELIEVVEVMSPDAFHYVIMDYLGRPVSGSSLEPVAGDDASDARWVSVDRLHEVPLTDAVRRVIARGQEMLGGSPVWK